MGSQKAKFIGETLPKIHAALGLTKLFINFFQLMSFIFVINVTVPWGDSNPLLLVLPYFQFNWEMPVNVFRFQFWALVAVTVAFVSLFYSAYRYRKFVEKVLVLIMTQLIKQEHILECFLDSDLDSIMGSKHYSGDAHITVEKSRKILNYLEILSYCMIAKRPTTTPLCLEMQKISNVGRLNT